MAQSAQPTLLFIPDISGFTAFVNQTEIDHSRHIIEELLETIIDADEIGLQVSEIEGDAILFYREGPAPTAAELLAQVQRMYIRFHAHLRRYETHRICQCGACNTASGLTLKFITHYGDVSTNQVKSHSKLFGPDVIVAHRLLKNTIPSDEYLLVTHDLISACATWVEVEQVAWSPPQRGTDAYDTGPVSYCHISLTPLRELVPAPTIAEYGHAAHTHEMASVEAVIEAPLDMVFDVISDLSARPLWTPIKGSDRMNHAIPQGGSTHRCVINDTEGDPFIVSHAFSADDDRVTFTDTEQKRGFSSVYVLRRTTPHYTHLEQHLMLKDSVFLRLFFRLFLKRRFIRDAGASFDRLNAYCKTLLSEGRQHPSRVVLYAEQPVS